MAEPRRPKSLGEARREWERRGRIEFISELAGAAALWIGIFGLLYCAVLLGHAFRSSTLRDLLAISMVLGLFGLTQPKGSRLQSVVFIIKFYVIGVFLLFVLTLLLSFLSILS